MFWTEFKSDKQIRFAFLVFVSVAHLCLSNQLETADSAFHRCGGGPFMLMNKSDDMFKTVSLERVGEQTMFI